MNLLYGGATCPLRSPAMTIDHTDPFAGIPIGKLRVFDAAARCKNFVAAGAELGMTQGAVSRHIKSLEARLGTPLFRRGPRGVTLTEGGDLLADYVRRAFDELANGLQRLGQPRRRTTLVVVAPRSFAWRVLAPRIGSFVTQYPWIDLRLDSHRYYVDIGHWAGDVSVGLGTGQWDELTVERLTRDTVFPVCAPSLCRSLAPMTPKADFFRGHQLLHYAERTHWSMWLRAAKLDPKLADTGPRFSETALALAAAEAGQGVAIARMSLIADALARGTLVRPFRTEIDDGLSYFLLMRSSDAGKPMIKAFGDWLRDEMVSLGKTSARLRMNFAKSA
jgi:LysR family transcriptional regulator, glycine cleavage system transcriptional activator